MSLMFFTGTLLDAQARADQYNATAKSNFDAACQNYVVQVKAAYASDPNVADANLPAPPTPPLKATVNQSTAAIEYIVWEGLSVPEKPARPKVLTGDGLKTKADNPPPDRIDAMMKGLDTIYDVLLAIKAKLEA